MSVHGRLLIRIGLLRVILLHSLHLCLALLKIRISCLSSSELLGLVRTWGPVDEEVLVGWHALVIRMRRALETIRDLHLVLVVERSSTYMHLMRHELLLQLMIVVSSVIVVLHLGLLRCKLLFRLDSTWNFLMASRHPAHVSVGVPM